MKQNEEGIDFKLYAAVGDLVDAGALRQGTDAYGVALHVIHDGYDSLSANEREIYDDVVAPALLRRALKLETLWSG